MKRFIIVGTVVVLFVLALSACHGGKKCPAYSNDQNVENLADNS